MKWPSSWELTSTRSMTRADSSFCDFSSKLAQGAVTVPLESLPGDPPADEFERMATHLKTRVSEGRADMDHLRAFASLADEVIPDSQRPNASGSSSQGFGRP